MFNWKYSTFFIATVLSLAASARPADKELNLLAWSEYIPQEVIDGFTKETGVKINYETFASNEEMLAKVLAGAAKYDLLQPSEYMVEKLARLNKLEAIDFDKVPNIKNIGKDFLNLPHDPDRKFSVPWMAGTVGIVVNTEKVKDPIKGYKDVFQEKYKGRIIVVNDSRELVTWGLYTLNHDINEIDKETLRKVRPVIKGWIKLIKVYDSDSPKTALINGDVDLGVVWSGEAAMCWQKDKKFQYVLAAEGAHRFIDNLAIPAGAKNKDSAMKFMNYILRPEVSKLISDKFPYTNPNLEARKLLTKDQLENPASYPKEPKLATFRDIGKQAAEIDRMVTQLRAE